ncbi:MAG: putative rane protein [Anaerocolumna sp.]|nr:putative rane protein [Anaerocolumna sp.]
MYFISFFSLSLMFSACYYMSYRHALNEFNEKAVERNEELKKLMASNGSKLPGVDNDLAQEDNGEDVADSSVAVDSMTNYTIMPSTVYKLQVYDSKTGTTTEEYLPIPSYLIGLNRLEVIEYLNNYSQELPLSEFEKGLISFELVSFTNEEIVLKKTYNEDKVEYKYYLKSENGYIVAYYGDKKTVFDYTSVSVENLPERDIQELEAGILVKDLEQLYGLLENYSS